MSGERVRSIDRNVFIYDLQNLDVLLGGLVLTHGVTNASFYAMVEIVIIVSNTFFLYDDDGGMVPRDAQPLLPGNYFVMTDGIVQVSDEPVLTRGQSLQTGPRVESFVRDVRERDGRCVVSKVMNQSRVWYGFQASHIFPLAYEQQWSMNDYGRWISLPPSRGGAINSVQNGLLLRSDIHSMFDGYMFSINPDDGYKVVFFQGDSLGLAGSCLDDILLNDPRRPSTELLRWHFRQAVLVNMRGAGEPYFEHDFPPGSDVLADIREGPMAAERMEFELLERLARHAETRSSDTDDDASEGGDVSDKG